MRLGIFEMREPLTKKEEVIARRINSQLTFIHNVEWLESDCMIRCVAESPLFDDLKEYCIWTPKPFYKFSVDKEMWVTVERIKG